MSVETFTAPARTPPASADSVPVGSAPAGQPTERPTVRISRRGRPGFAVWLGGSVVLLAIIGAILAPWLAPYPPLRQNLDARLQRPGPAHLLGTDELGRDVLSRLIFGARISLLMAVGAMVLALPLGALCGVAAGFFGGWADLTISRAIDILLAFPTTLLALVLIASLGPSPNSVMVALGLAFLPGFARIARSAVAARARA